MFKQETRLLRMTVEPNQKRFFKKIGTMSVGHSLQLGCEIQGFRIHFFPHFFSVILSLTDLFLSLGMLCWKQEIQPPTEVLNSFLGLDLK